MTSEVSKTQIDRLGDRLKRGNISEADLRLLDMYRRSFAGAYEIVVGTIRKELMLEPTGRAAKSTTSISEKLRRDSIRLTQIQDIAGCRLVAQDIAAQDAVIQSLNGLFENTTVVDRRQQPSHGYRAVHVIVNYRGKLIEIQVRTSLQHLWAELSEKFSDVIDPAIKYGGGDEDIQETLTVTSFAIAAEESAESKLKDAQISLSYRNNLTDDTKNKLDEAQDALIKLRRDMQKSISDLIKRLEEVKGETDALSD